MGRRIAAVALCGALVLACGLGITGCLGRAARMKAETQAVLQEVETELAQFEELLNSLDTVQEADFGP